MRDAGSYYVSDWVKIVDNVNKKPIWCWPVIGDDGTIYLGTFWLNVGDCTNYITALNMSDGSYKWSSMSDYRIAVARDWTHVPPVPEGHFGAIEGSPCLGPSGTVYFGTGLASGGYWDNKDLMLRVTDQGLTAYADAFTVVTGQPGNFDPIPSIGIKSTNGQPFAIFACENRNVYAADPATGALVSTFPYGLNSYLDHPDTVIMKDGTILVGTNDGKLYAIWGPN